MHSCLRNLGSPSSTRRPPSEVPAAPDVPPPQGPTFLPPRRPSFSCSLSIFSAPCPFDMAVSSWSNNYNFLTLQLPNPNSNLTFVALSLCFSPPPSPAELVALSWSKTDNSQTLEVLLNPNILTIHLPSQAFKTTHTLLDALTVISLYPLSIVFVYILEYQVGLN